MLRPNNIEFTALNRMTRNGRVSSRRIRSESIPKVRGDIVEHVFSFTNPFGAVQLCVAIDTSTKFGGLLWVLLRLTLSGN